YYTIIGPGIIKSNRKYSAAVALHEADGPCVIRVGLDGPNFHTTQDVELQPLETKLIEFFPKGLLDAPTDVVLNDGSITVVFYGKYTFNKYVEGNATVILYYNDASKPLAKKELYVERLTSVEFKIEDLQGISNLNDIRILVEITEKNTGKSEHNEHFIRLHKQRYNIEIPQDEIDYKDNKPYRLKAAVKHLTGAAVLDYKTPVTMRHGNEVYESFLDQNGEAIFEFEHQAEANHVFQFKDSTSFFPNIYASKSLQLYNKKLGLRVANEKIRLGKPLQIEVTSTDVIPYLEYIIMGHGSLIRAEHVEVPPNQRSHIIEIIPSIEMVPKSFIYVYFVENGNLRYEEMTLNFPNELENQISIGGTKTSDNQVQMFTLDNKLLSPNLMFSILAVGLGVFLLDSSYDLYKDNIITDLVEDVSYTRGATEYISPEFCLVTSKSSTSTSISTSFPSKLPASTRYVSFDMEGNGNCLVQVKHQYHSMDTNEHRHFNIKPKVITNRIQRHQYGNKEVNLPSGYTSQAESNENLKNNKLVEKIETKNSESVVIVYLDNLKANVNHCLNIPADKSNEVNAAKPAAIIMYDYYNLNRTNTVFYSFM
ncbi:hypothetical protein DOY81_011784, partial [Sarcophaga bullata]